MIGALFTRALAGLPLTLAPVLTGYLVSTGHMAMIPEKYIFLINLVLGGILCLAFQSQDEMSTGWRRGIKMFITLSGVFGFIALSAQTNELEGQTAMQIWGIVCLFL